MEYSFENQYITESSTYIKAHTQLQPKIGVVLGSGLGGLVGQMNVCDRISYRDIPHFPVSTVAGHSGELVMGYLNGTALCVLNGRKHYYEGVPMREVVYPTMVLKALGIETVIFSNAAGGLNPSFHVGDLMVMTDHISHFWDSPLQRIAGMPAKKSPTTIYNPELVRLTLVAAKTLGIAIQHGVYLAHSGPYYGTRAESRMQSQLGADAVGMSTIPEVIIAKSLGMNILSFSVITDLAYIGVTEHPSHEAVLEAAKVAGEKLVRIVTELVGLSLVKRGNG